jgi:hypothetical protein
MNPVTRRSFLEKAGLVTTVASGSLAAVTGSEVAESGVGARREVDAAEGYTRYAMARCVAESTFTSGKAYTDPFNEIELDVIFTDPQGQERRMTAFWGGRQAWRVRYSPPTAGRYAFRTISTDT